MTQQSLTGDLTCNQLNYLIYPVQSIRRKRYCSKGKKKDCKYRDSSIQQSERARWFTKTEFQLHSDGSSNDKAEIVIQIAKRALLN